MVYHQYCGDEVSHVISRYAVYAGHWCCAIRAGCKKTLCYQLLSRNGNCSLIISIPFYIGSSPGLLSDRGVGTMTECFRNFLQTSLTACRM